MCGIAGSINHTCPEAVYTDRLFHRGPDAQHVFVDSATRVSLAHTRLSIIDIAHAHQPMHYQSFTLVYNGEIYNFQELRQNLQEFDFQTDSDTEVLLYLYVKYRESMFEMIDGMFAFALLDRECHRLFLARDRAGKKPLYFTKQGESFYFASELNALRALVDVGIDEEAIAGYVRSGLFFRNQTAYSGVEALENGHWMSVDLQTLEISRQAYWRIEEPYALPKVSDLESGILAELDARLEKSVKDRLLSSDLEVGAFLSGGIDSSLVVAMASKYRERLKTFTVRFEGGYDEAPLARLVAQKYHTDHTELQVSMNLKEDIETILLCYGQPFFDSSCIPSYYVSQAAKEHVSVILNGDGADELFGGYRRYVPFANGMMKVARALSCLAGILPKPQDKKSRYNYLYRLLQMGASKSHLSLYLRATTDIWEQYETALLKKEPDDFESRISELMAGSHSELSQMLMLDFQLILFGDLLPKMDIATMAHSLEGRSPFLSKYLLEFAPRLPDTMKIHQTTTKYALRKLAESYLPPELIHQPKRGFEVPLKAWVEDELKENIQDLLQQGCYAESFVQRTFIDALLANKAAVPAEKRAKMLWNLYALEVWKRAQR